MSLLLNPATTANIEIDMLYSQGPALMIHAHKVQFADLAERSNAFKDLLAGTVKNTTLVAQRPYNDTVINNVHTVTAWHDNKNFTVHDNYKKNLEKFNFDFMNPNFMQYNICIKDTADACKDTGLAERLHEDGVTDVLLHGSTKSMCVWSSAIGLADAGFNVHIVDDLVFTEPEYIWRKTKNEIALQYRDRNIHSLDTDERFKHVTSDQVLKHFKLK